MLFLNPFLQHEMKIAIYIGKGDVDNDPGIVRLMEELRIGGNKSPFDKPCNMFLEGECAMVSNRGSNKLMTVNLNTYEVFEYETFEEPLYQYINVNENRFVVLESGLYLI